MYRLGAGITNINNKSQYERTNEWSFTPNLILGYQLSKNQSLQLISSYKPNTPSGEQLSSNIVQLVPNSKTGKSIPKTRIPVEKPTEILIQQ